MKSVHLLLLTITSTLTMISCNQGQPLDCKKVLDQEMYMGKFHNKPDQKAIDSDCAILSECGNLDSIDSQVFLRDSLLGNVLEEELKKGNTSQKITFRICRAFIENYKTNHKGTYLFFREKVVTRMELEKLSVNFKEFETLRPKFEKAGFEDSLINAFKAYLEINQYQEWTYKDALAAYFNSLEAEKRTREPLEFTPLGDLDEFLYEGRKKGKNCLIYFSAFTSVNAKIFENEILADPEIRAVVRKDYIYRIAYVDDKTKAKNDTRTVGEINSGLQQEKFKSNAQPTLYILSPNGKIISDWNYEKGPEAFQKFLEQGISK